jgi:hypothetical protein
VVIVPVIIEHCDWKASPLVQFKALPKDGKPVSDWTNKDAAWLDVVTELRKLIAKRTPQGRLQAPAPERGPGPSQTVSPKYRVKKDFDQIDKEDYRGKTYEEIRNYFEKSCAEIEGIDGIRARYQSIDANSFTCTVINKNIKSGRSGTAHITVRHGGHSFLGDISWSYTANAPANTSNGWFSVETDGYEQHLSANVFTGGNDRRKWYPQEAASYLWQEFINQAGISL